MSRGADALREAVRARFLLAATVAAFLGAAAACSQSERSSLPTEPARGASTQAAAEDPLVPRMPIVRLPRRGTVTPSLTVTPSGPPSSPTPTSAAPPATATATPTVTATPSRTPTSGPGTISIRLRGIDWQWDFYGPGVSNGGPRITLHSGQKYQIEFFNDGPENSSFHTFSGIAPLGLSALSVAPGESVTRTFTANQTGTFPFACTNSSCGVGHDGMTGTVSVVP